MEDAPFAHYAARTRKRPHATHREPSSRRSHTFISARTGCTCRAHRVRAPRRPSQRTRGRPFGATSLRLSRRKRPRRKPDEATRMRCVARGLTTTRPLKPYLLPAHQPRGIATRMAFFCAGTLNMYSLACRVHAHGVVCRTSRIACGSFTFALLIASLIRSHIF